MEFNKIKKEAIKLAEKGHFRDFFQLIEPLGFNDWMSILFPSKEKDSFRFNKTFWKELTSSKYFPALLTHENAVPLLDAYFKNTRNANVTFNEAFAEANLTLFIEKFKSNRAIFRKEFIKSVQFLRNSDDEQVRMHADFWQFIHDKEKQFYQLEKDKELWLALNPVELLSYCCFYLMKMDNGNPFVFLNPLFSYYFFEKRKIDLDIENQDLKEVAVTVLTECTQNPTNPYFKSLDNLVKWFRFIEDESYVYMYSDNFFLSKTGHHFHLNSKDTIQDAKWKTIGNKIELLPVVTEMNYDERAELILEQEKIEIPGDTSESKRINRDFTIKDLSLKFLLHSMRYDIYKVDGIDVPVQEVSHTLNGFIENAKLNYSLPISAFKEKHPTLDNLMAIFHLCRESMQENRIPEIPLRVDSLDEFESILGEYSRHTKAIKKIICCSPKDINYPKHFDRFHPFIKIEGQPFFEINNHIISFQNLMGKLHNSFKTINLNLHYHSKRRCKDFPEFRPSKFTQKEDSAFEIYFKEELFKDYEFELIKSSIDIWKNNRRIGEIDVLIFHQGILMLIELKRTHFRTSLSETDYESKNVHQKAAKQLNRILKYLNQEENHLKIKEDLGVDMTKVKKILPLVISTSLEQDRDMIDGILKQNFFQLNFHATFFNRNLDNLLQQLYDVLKDDVFWDCFHVLENHPRVIPIDGIKLRMSFPKNISAKVPNDDNEFYHYKKGNEYYRMKDFNAAIIHFEKARYINPFEATYYSSVANCLAEMKQAMPALQLYCEALTLRKDPIIYHYLKGTQAEFGIYERSV